MTDEQVEIVRRLYAIAKIGLMDEALMTATEDIIWFEPKSPLEGLNDKDKIMIESRTSVILEDMESELDGTMRRLFPDDYLRIMS